MVMDVMATSETFELDEHFSSFWFDTTYNMFKFRPPPICWRAGYRRVTQLKMFGFSPAVWFSFHDLGTVIHVKTIPKPNANWNFQEFWTGQRWTVGGGERWDEVRPVICQYLSKSMDGAIRTINDIKHIKKYHKKACRLKA